MKKWLIIAMIIAILVLTLIVLAIFSIDILLSDTGSKSIGVRYGPELSFCLMFRPGMVRKN